MESHAKEAPSYEGLSITELSLELQNEGLSASASDIFEGSNMHALPVLCVSCCICQLD